jgi:signal transduction histidine kinase
VTDHVVLEVQDDGVGFGPDGGSLAGSGQGLALHETMMAIVGGALAVDRPVDGGARVTLTAPRA